MIRNAIPLLAGEILRIVIKGIRAIDAIATKLVCTICTVISTDLYNNLSQWSAKLHSAQFMAYSSVHDIHSAVSRARRLCYSHQGFC